MKKIAILCLTILFSCSRSEKLFEPLTSELISGNRLWYRIAREGDYTKYSFWPGHEGLQEGQTPHGPFHKIYINNPLASALGTDLDEAPMGTIIVKENYTIEEQVDKITVMAKIPGYNEEGGNWFWAAYSKNGEVLAEGTPSGCISCHSGMKKNDYIIIRNLNNSTE